MIFLPCLPGRLKRICSRGTQTFEGLRKIPVGESVRDDVKVTFTADANQAAAVNAVVMNFAEKANAIAK